MASVWSDSPGETLRHSSQWADGHRSDRWCPRAVREAKRKAAWYLRTEDQIELAALAPPTPLSSEPHESSDHVRHYQLTPEDVRRIRKEVFLAPRDKSLCERLARELKVSKHTVRAIRARKRWAWVH